MLISVLVVDSSKLNDASNYISTLTWYLPREFVHIFPVSPPKLHLHHTQPPWPCVEEQGPVGSHIKWLIWWPYDALASPYPAPSLSKSHEHSPGNWSERLPTDGGNVSRSRFDPTSEKMFYIHHLHSSQFPKTLGVAIKLCTKTHLKKPDEMNFENWLIWFISASSRLHKNQTPSKSPGPGMTKTTCLGISWQALQRYVIHPMLSRCS